MKEIVLAKTGPPSVLSLQERADPVPTGSDVRVRVKASGINFADILARKGLYPDSPSLPCVVGYEVSGTIDAVGPDAPQTLLNADVLLLTKFKGYADTVIVDHKSCHLKPASMSFVDAASIPVVYLTAWMLIYVMGGLRAGQTVLIQNAGGAVGLAAIDIARHIGAVSIGTASGRKHRFLKERGLVHAIDYRTENVAEHVMRLTNNKGVDLIIDPLGGDNWKINYGLLRSTGRLGVFGASSLMEFDGFISKIWGYVSFFARMPRWSPLELMKQNRGVFGVNLGHMWDEPERIAEWLRQIIDAAADKDGWVRPCVDAVFSFDQVADAHEYIEQRKNTGKVVLVPTNEMASAWTKTVNNA